jgi:hypothetical protein
MEDYLVELDNRNADDTVSGGITSVPAYRNTVKRFQNWIDQNCTCEEDDEAEACCPVPPISLP